MSPWALISILVMVVTGCAAVQARDSNKKWSDGVVVAQNMCASDGSVQHTKDPEGKRVFCGLEELVGTHLPKCICRDEAQAADQRDEAQQYLRDADRARQLLGGN